MPRFSLIAARRGRWRFAIAGAVALAAFISSTSWGAAVERPVVVPRLGGDVLAVYGRLHAAGLRVSIPRGLSFDSLAPSRVVRAAPASGRRVPRGSVVTLYLARTAERIPRSEGRLPSYLVPNFNGQAVSVAYRWVRHKTVAFEAHLGPLRAAGARVLFDNYRVTTQRPPAGSRLSLGQRIRSARRARLRLRPLTVWGVQPVVSSAPPSPTPALLTQSGAPPTSVTTGPATVTGQTTALLTGSVNPEGSVTSYYFSYGPTSAYGNQTPVQQAGSGSFELAVNSALSGLDAVTVYHYRLVATSSADTTYGADEAFTTAGYYQNPVYDAAAMPDPFVLDDGGKHSDYWAFGTGNLFPLLHSTDLVHWSAQGTAMTSRPAWVVSTGDWHPWAPSVIRSDHPCPGTSSTGCYVMYYGGLSAQLNLNCIGVATAGAPGGPYTDQGPLQLAGNSGGATTPLGCGDGSGVGNIDPSPFVDSSGQAYLYLSTNRSCSGGTCMRDPTISVIPLASDLLQAAGPRVALFSGDQGGWEAAGVQVPTVEGPSMEFHDGTYYLLYSGGSFQGAYGMGYATADSPTGPFTKSPSNPILAGTAAVFGPGGGDRLVTGPHGGLWMVYAARDSYSDPRTLRIDPFRWDPGGSVGAPDVPVIGGPTATPQPAQP